MPPVQEFILTKFHAVPSKVQWGGVTMAGLLCAAFAAYGVAPEGATGLPAQGTSKQVTELIAPIKSAAAMTLPNEASAETGLAPFVALANPQEAGVIVAAPAVLTQVKLAPATINKTAVGSVPGTLSLPPRLDRFLQSEKVRKGDSIASLLSRLGASDSELLKFIAKNPVAVPFAKIQPGRMVQAEIGSEGKIYSLHYVQPALDDEDGAVTPGTRFSLSRGDDGFFVKQEAAKLSTYTDTKVFSIRSTLAAAAESSKVPESVANQIVDLFSDVIDFEKEARRGDRVKVIYETLADAQSLEAPVPGRVLAVEWVSGKRVYTAVWFGDSKNTDSGEYYAFDGKSLKKSFLRYPIEFARISSEFSEARKHPIFKDWRAHRGVDFAAPLGTKVRSTGDGAIEFIGTQRGYGNVITVKHGKFSTTYAHLNEFTEGLKVGVKVRQGDVIGFVGRTGFATGAHLHYEFKVDGEQANPLTAELPSRGPLDATNKKLLAQKSEQVKSLMAQLGTAKLAQFQ